MVEKYRMVCLIIIDDPLNIYSPADFEQEINRFNEANKPNIKVEVQSIDKETTDKDLIPA